MHRKPLTLLAVAALICSVFVAAACTDGDSATSDEPEATTTMAVETTETAEVTTTPPADASTDAVDPVALQLAFDGENCTYEGVTELIPGPVELTFLNESEESAAVNVTSIEAGYTIQDVIEDVGPEPGTEEAPSWQRHLGTWRPVAPGTSYVWAADLNAGLYAMVCGHYSVSEPYAIWFGTGLTVES